MQRVGTIDGLRGLCLVLMMLTHLELGRPMVLANLHVKQLGFADSAQGFIFLAGLVIGMIGMRQIERGGEAAQSSWSRWRALRLYAVHISLLLALIVLAQVLPEAADAWAGWMGPLTEPGSAYHLAAVFLLFQPSYMDILPQYIVYLMLAPLVLQQVRAGRTGLVLGLSFGLWLMTQLGLHLPLVGALEMALAGVGMEVGTRAFFNPMGWQLVFVTGLVLGAHMRGGKLTERLRLDPRRTDILSAALVILALAAVWRLTLTFGWMSEDLLNRLIQYEHRAELGLLTMLDFAALAYTTAWVLVAGPKAASAGVRLLGAGLDHLVSHPWLALIGRHALPVFTWHVVLIYLLMLADYSWGGFAEPVHSAIGVLAILSLTLPALASEYLPRLARTGAATA